MSRGGWRGGGRPAGALNKRTQELFDLVAEKYPGYNAVEENIKIGLNPAVEPGVRVTANEYVAKRMYPQVKAVEMQIEADVNQNLKVKQKIDITPELLERAEDLYRAIAAKILINK